MRRYAYCIAHQRPFTAEPVLVQEALLGSMVISLTEKICNWDEANSFCLGHTILNKNCRLMTKDELDRIDISSLNDLNVLLKTLNAPILSNKLWGNEAVDTESKNRLSMASRYEHNINIKKTENDSENNNWRQFYPRKPNFLKHYLFYKAIPIMARLCTKLKTVDIINVYNRDTPLLLNYRKNKPAKEESVDVILRERNKPLNANEMKMYRDEKKALLENMKKRKVSKYSLFLYNLLFHRNK